MDRIEERRMISDLHGIRKAVVSIAESLEKIATPVEIAEVAPDDEDEKVEITEDMVERFYIAYSERMRHYSDFSKQECRDMLEFAVTGKVTR